MASLKLSHIYKVYENGHKAVNDFNIDIIDKEFIVFVGPSGCGKSTTLRMIAGLEEITAGDLFIGDTLVNDMEPKDRDIAMVFQNYALYPHMTVYENMAFGLRNKHIPKEEIDAKVKEAARILDLTDYLDRKPKAMSGGQRQRVALGRAIVRDPKVFLLDEPLSNLDAKLRAQMRTEITRLHKKLGTTFIYVTHDQVEAMTMGTRIVVMKLGYVQQIDTPMNLYNKPHNKFVAGFIGTPQMNFFDVKMVRSGNDVQIQFPNSEQIVVPYENVCKINDSFLHGERPVVFGIRPEHLSVSKKKTGISCIVSAVEHLGNETIIYADLGEKDVEFSMADNGQRIIAKITEDVNYDIGDKINLDVDFSKAHYFRGDDEGVTLIEDIPASSDVVAEVDGKKAKIFGKTIKLPNEIVKRCDGHTNVSFKISPRAIIPGKDFELKVTKIENVGEEKLAYLQNGDKIVFAIVDKSVKVGDYYSFSIKYDQITIVIADGVVLSKPLGDNVCFVGRFEKKEIKEGRERVLHFFANVFENSFEIEQANGFKMNSVEGNKCYSRMYRYEILRDNIIFAEEGIEAEVVNILDFGYKKYAVVQIGSDAFVVNDNGSSIGDKVHLTFDGKTASIYSIDIDMKIV